MFFLTFLWSWIIFSLRFKENWTWLYCNILCQADISWKLYSVFCNNALLQCFCSEFSKSWNGAFILDRMYMFLKHWLFPFKLILLRKVSESILSKYKVCYYELLKKEKKTKTKPKTSWVIQSNYWNTYKGIDA